jgi:hypothetical protein
VPWRILALFPSNGSHHPFLGLFIARWGHASNKAATCADSSPSALGDAGLGRLDNGADGDTYMQADSQLSSLLLMSGGCRTARQSH